MERLTQPGSPSSIKDNVLREGLPFSASRLRQPCGGLPETSLKDLVPLVAALAVVSVADMASVEACALEFEKRSGVRERSDPVASNSALCDGGASSHATKNESSGTGGCTTASGCYFVSSYAWTVCELLR